MLDIKKFFEKIQNTRAKEIFLRQAVKESIEKHTPVKISLESISFSSTTVVLKNLNQSARSTIFIKREAILKEIGERQLGRAVTDIR
jgi:hypothetical protein